MAGDWIPWQVGLTSKPEVMEIARTVAKDRRWVAAVLMEFWEWCDQQSPDGCLGAMLEELPGLIIGTDNLFWQAVVSVGWLRILPSGLSIPNFDRWLGRCAKKRLAHARKTKCARSSAHLAHNKRTSCPVLSYEEEQPGRVYQREDEGGAGGEGAPEADFTRSPPSNGRCVPFADFWALYPLKAEELRAKRQWGNLFVTAELFAVMRLALGEQRLSAQWRSGKVPHAWRWLEGERWKDELRKDTGGQPNHELTKHRFRDPGRFAAEAGAGAQAYADAPATG